MHHHQPYPAPASPVPMRKQADLVQNRDTSFLLLLFPRYFTTIGNLRPFSYSKAKCINLLVYVSRRVWHGGILLIKSHEIQNKNPRISMATIDLQHCSMAVAAALLTLIVYPWLRSLLVRYMPWLSLNAAYHERHKGGDDSKFLGEHDISAKAENEHSVQIESEFFADWWSNASIYQLERRAIFSKVFHLLLDHVLLFYLADPQHRAGTL